MISSNGMHNMVLDVNTIKFEVYMYARYIWVGVYAGYDLVRVDDIVNCMHDMVSRVSMYAMV
jgi:hypothetical protein